MGRPNYNNRKIEGVKLGQAVAKDLVKRIPPGLGSKAAIRDPVVELDITGKALGDDGFAEVATALVTSIEYTSEHGRLVKLEELCLRDNNLDVSSLPALGQVVRMAAQDLRDLDISNNLIEIRTDEEAQIFQNFLRCFAKCCVLRRFDLSGNALGPKAFEIFTRVYGQENPIDLIAPESPDGSLEHDGGTGRSNIDDPTALERRLRCLSVTSDLGENASEVSRSSPGQAPIAQEKSRKERKTPVKASQQVIQSESPRLYLTTSGLRSVPYIVLSETKMTELCALHLSYIIPQHCTPEQLLPRVPPAKAGAPAQQLTNYDLETRCQGIVYYPNSDLGSTGTKMLQLSEIVRKGLFDEMDIASLEASQLATSDRKPRSAGRLSEPNSSPMSTCHKRWSGTTGAAHDRVGSEMEAIANELERLRHRVQGNTLRDAGLSSNDLWYTSLKMLCIGRALCPTTAIEPYSRDESDRIDTEPIKHGGSEYTTVSTEPNDASSTTSPPVLKPTPLAYRHPNQPLTLRLGQEWRNGKLVLTPILPSPRTPTAPTMAALPTPPPSSPPPPESPKTPEVSYRTSLPCGFTTDIWRRIVAHAASVYGIMSEEQQAAIVAWAMNRKTLALEEGSLGKPKSAQIWKVLEATECLAYEMKV